MPNWIVGGFGDDESGAPEPQPPQIIYVPITPDHQQSILVKALELPLPSTMTSTLGIFQSDVIIRSALIAGMADLRANPWLLDYVFASLPRDPTTFKEYGEREVEAAKKWFLTTDIPVFMNTRLDDATLPCVSIALLESSESSETTLGDVHYDVEEDTDADWPTVAGPFTPEAYSAGTGILVIPESAMAGRVVNVGMIVLDRIGRQHVIEEVLDSRTVRIKAGTVADFTNAQVKPQRPAYVTKLESSVFKETYSIGCHVMGEAIFLTYLHSIVTFILLRYKQALLEARGFERSTLASSDFRKDENFDNEVVYSRFMQVTGFVRQYWPKDRSRKIDGVSAFPVPYEHTVTDEKFADLEDRDSIDLFNKGR